jgi:hypothetical protein
VLHEESNPTTARLVHASDVDETIAPISIGSIGAENVYSFVLAELVPCDFRLGSDSTKLKVSTTSRLWSPIADIKADIFSVASGQQPTFPDGSTPCK